jgi:hypothetical protein
MKDDLQVHQDRVDDLIGEFVKELNFRAWEHDFSKSVPPEKEVFEKYTSQLKDLTFGSPEYYASLQALNSTLNPALDHHYANNRHHPQYFENGIDGMNLVDIMEMFCDWKAATEKHKDGDFGKSIEHNAGRFKMSEQLVKIFENTKRDFGW